MRVNVRPNSYHLGAPVQMNESCPENICDRNIVDTVQFCLNFVVIHTKKIIITEKTKTHSATTIDEALFNSMGKANLVQLHPHGRKRQ